MAAVKCQMEGKNGQVSKALPGVGKRVTSTNSFACLLGFIDDPGIPKAIPDEYQRCKIVSTRLENNKKLLSDQQRQIQEAEFAALYLPQLVDRVVNLSSPLPKVPQNLQKDVLLDNAYTRMLGKLTGTYYMAKYLKSTNPIAFNNEVLISVLAERVVAVGPDWTHWFENPPQPSVNYRAKASFFSRMLFELLINAPVHKNRKDILSPKLRKSLRDRIVVWWIRSGPDEDLRFSACLIASLLVPAQSLNQLILDSQKSFSKNACSLPECTASQSLKECARCQAVLYCSDSHQKQHWKHATEPHRPACFETWY